MIFERTVGSDLTKDRSKSIFSCELTAEERGDWFPRLYTDQGKVPIITGQCSEHALRNAYQEWIGETESDHYKPVIAPKLLYEVNMSLVL